jgi:hypothetical protein
MAAIMELLESCKDQMRSRAQGTYALGELGVDGLAQLVKFAFSLEAEDQSINRIALGRCERQVHQFDGGPNERSIVRIRLGWRRRLLSVGWGSHPDSSQFMPEAKDAIQS